MLDLLVNNAPIDGLWSSTIDEYDCLIKDALTKPKKGGDDE